MFGLACMMILVLVLMILLSLYGRTMRQAETERTLEEAIDTAMSEWMETEDYPATGKEAFAADFLETLLVQLNSTSDVQVSILDADEEKGLLSVEVTEEYQHPNGTKGSVSAVRTVIFDRTQKEDAAYYQVDFYLSDEERYKSYVLPENSYCVMPKAPKKDGRKFLYWRFVQGGAGKAGASEVTGEESGQARSVLSQGGMPWSATKDARLIAVFE
jgi:hypothetical protein